MLGAEAAESFAIHAKRGFVTQGSKYLPLLVKQWADDCPLGHSVLGWVQCVWPLGLVGEQLAGVGPAPGPALHHRLRCTSGGRIDAITLSAPLGRSKALKIGATGKFRLAAV